MLTKEKFVKAINVLREQYDYDSSYTTLIEQVIRVDSASPYDNSKLVNFIMQQLQEEFPAVDGECLIEYYCYEINFGRVLGNLITAEQLWDRLSNRKSEADDYSVEDSKNNL